MISKWKQLFLSKEMELGTELFNAKRVSGLVASNTRCMGNVKDGSKSYLVRVRDLNREYPNMQCTCPESTEKYCAHEAAVMLQWESEFQEKEEDITALEIFPADEAHRKLFFQLGKDFRKTEITPEVYREAVQLIEADALEVDTPIRTYYSLDEPVAVAYVMLKNSRRQNSPQLFSDDKFKGYRDGEMPIFSMAFSKNGIDSWTCNHCGRHAESFVYRYGRRQISVCSTCLASMILLDEYLLLHNPGDETNRLGQEFLKAFGKRRRLTSDEEVERRKIVQIQPRLKSSYHDIELSFKVGVNKLYVLKDPEAFVQAVDQKEIFRLGKNNSIDFAKEEFTDQSAGYFDLIRTYVNNIQMMNDLTADDYYYRKEFTAKRDMPLQGENLDRFYELAKGSTVDYSSDSGDNAIKQLLIDEVEPQIALTVEMAKDKNGDQVKGIALTGELPDHVAGGKDLYMIQNGVFGPISEAISERLRPLYQVQEFGEINLKFGEKQIPEFYYRILPVLEEDPCITIEYRDMSEIEELVPPEAVYTFWMDIENGKLLCVPQVSYEDKTYTIAPLQKKDLPLEYPRNEGQETYVSDTLSEILPEYDSETRSYSCKATDDRLFDFMQNDLDVLNGIGEVQGTDEFNRIRLRKTSSIRIGVSVESDLLNLQISSDDISSEELFEILESYRKAKKYHRLRSGEFISLDKEEGIATLANAMDEMRADIDSFTEGKMHLPLYRALYVNKLLEDHDELAANRDAAFRTLIRNFNSVKETEAEVPEHLKGVLRNYQEYGFRWLSTLAAAGFGGILADDMGLGKTLQTITFLAAQIQKNEEKKHYLIVCPASLIYNWEEEFKRFAPEISVCVMAGTAKVRKEHLLRIADGSEEVDVLITSYDLLKRDIDVYRKLEFDIQVIDEAQNIKNPTAAASKAVKVIRSRIRFALTGTPVENRLSELWSIFDYLMPGFLFTYPQFREEMENPITKEKDEEATKRLQRMVSPFILRRLKQQVLKDLPEKLEENRYARFDSTQQKYYDAQVMHMKKALKADENMSKIQVLSELTKIRQICCDPHLLADNYKGDSAKLLACIDLVKSAMEGGHRILLFSQFTSMLAIIEEALDRENIEYYKITGETSKEERIRLVHAFNKGNTPVFLISLKAGGTGLNLTGADVVIHYDPWWNAAAQNQATDRAHRIGQTKEVTVYRLIVKNTIEEKIMQMQEAKKDLADAVLSGDQTSISNMTTEELMDLLEQ